MKSAANTAVKTGNQVAGETSLTLNDQPQGFAETMKVYSLPHQPKVKAFYLRHSIQILVALIIFLNFLTSAVRAQILPEENTTIYSVFTAFEWFYVYAFLIELVINMYGHYWWEFWASGWNWFDFIIVLISLLAIYLPGIPGLSVLRLFRAFRVIRLFKRVREMKKIIEGIMKSLPSLSYASVALCLIIGIWAIIGVDSFSEMDVGGPKGYYFGNFFKACLSLCQITTFDSWSSGISRDIIYEKGPGAAIYFATFVFISSIIMMNVLVALLLDNYLSASPEGEGTVGEVISQLSSAIQKEDLDLGQLAQYINERALPDFITNHHRSADKLEKEVVTSEDKPQPKKQLGKKGAVKRIPSGVHSAVVRIERRLIALKKKSERLIEGTSSSPLGSVRITLGSIHTKHSGSEEQKGLKEQQRLDPTGVIRQGFIKAIPSLLNM